MKILNRITIAPSSIGIVILVAMASFVLTILGVGRNQVGYVMVGGGLLAGLLQWLYCKRKVEAGHLLDRNSLIGQLYGFVILSGFCSVPGVVLARVVIGQKIF